MNYYLATIQYDGTGYAGFQWQQDIPTIQSEVNHTLAQILKGKFSTMGTSRTDSGVHAREQILKITSENPISCLSFLAIFNQLLPSQICCLSINPCDSNFNPATAAASKEYRYYFTNQGRVSMDHRRFIANIANPLDQNLLQECVRMFRGRHDFHNFYSTGSNVKSTIRDVYVCDLSLIDPLTVFPAAGLFQLPRDISECYQLKIEANGFLKQMIRHLVSALWMVGSGKLTLEDFNALLNGPKREKQFWKVASPKGLHLYRINLRLE